MVAAWTASGTIGLLRPDTPSISDSAKKFLEDAQARQLQPSTIMKLKNLLEKRLLSWCTQKGFLHLMQLDVDSLRQFRATWLEGPLTASRNLQRLRSFLSFCQQAGWIEKNPAGALKPPKLPDKSTKVKVFTEDEIAKILAACDEYPRWNSYGQNNRTRIRAFVLTLRYSPACASATASGFRKLTS